MSSMGKAMMGTGEAEGEGRAVKAAEAAINNPLIDDYTLKGAKGLLVNITGGKDLKLFEVDEAVNKVRSEVDHEAELIIGAITDPDFRWKNESFNSCNFTRWTTARVKICNKYGS